MPTIPQSSSTSSDSDDAAANLYPAIRIYVRPPNPPYHLRLLCLNFSVFSVGARINSGRGTEQYASQNQGSASEGEWGPQALWEAPLIQLQRSATIATDGRPAVPSEDFAYPNLSIYVSLVDILPREWMSKMLLITTARHAHPSKSESGA